MTKQPESLRLADALEQKEYPPRRTAAAELRRLHAENERLREEGTKFHSNITFIGHFPGSESVEVMRLTRNGIWANPDVEIDNTAKIVLAALDVQLKELVQKAVAAEREACAKMFDGEVWAYDYREIAEAIRARGEQEIEL
jgi:hypothetical protein